MATATSLTAGKTWVTGESVTASKMNTAMTGSTTLVNDVDTGSSVSSGGSDVFKQKASNDLEFKGIKGGTNISVSSDTTDITINNDLTASSTSTDMTVGTKQMQWATGPSRTNPAAGSVLDTAITISGFSGTPDTCMVTTENVSGGSGHQHTAMYQLKSMTSTTVTVRLQVMSTFTGVIQPRILVIGTAS